MKATLLAFLLCNLCLQLELVASQTSVRSSEFLAKSYARDLVYEFEKGTAYPLVLSADAGYYVHVCDDHDRVQLRAAPVLQEKVKVLGNSLGAGRITVLPGKVSGLNATEIETTAKFVSGNSGSPILNASNEVIGVATLIEYFPDHEKIVEGSAFEDGRRVGVRLDRDIEWMAVDMGKFASSNRLILQTMRFIDELPMVMVAAISDVSTQQMALQSLTDATLKQWLRSRSTGLQAVTLKHQEKVQQGLARQGNRFINTPGYVGIQKAYSVQMLEDAQTVVGIVQETHREVAAGL